MEDEDGFPQLISHSTQIFVLAALSNIAASKPVVYAPVTLTPYPNPGCKGPNQPKSIEIPLGSCIDSPFFKSYKATTRKASPDQFECVLYIYSGLGCSADSFVSPGLLEVPPLCHSAAMHVTNATGAKSALYTCEG